MKTNALRNILLIILLTLVETTNLYSQDSNTSKGYLSYFGNDSTNINIRYAPCCSADLHLILSGVIYSKDTITINGHQYYYSTPKPLGLILEPSSHYLFPRLDTLFLREERDTGRLYRYYRNYFEMGETEKLICDMSMEEGDKMVYPVFCLQEDSVVAYRVNYSNGIKTIIVANPYFQTTFREGVLPEELPLWQEPLSDMYGTGECASASNTKLLCVYKDGVQVYGSNNDCFPNQWGIEEIKNNNISIYPNIVRGNDIITIESSEPIKEVLVMDVLGMGIEISKNIIISNKWQISLCGCPEPGMYFILIIANNSISYEKIILLN